MKLKKILCVVFIAAICLSTVGCAYNPETVMTVGETDIPSGLYLFYQYNALTEAFNEHGDTSLRKQDFLDNKSDIKIDGIPVRQWIDNKTMTLIKEYVFVENEFKRLGLEFSAYDEMYNNQIMESQWQQVASLFQKNGIGYDNFKRAMINSFKKTKVANSLYGEGGEQEIPIEELEEYFSKEYTRVDYLVVTLTDNEYGYPLEEATQKEIIDIVKQIMDAANAKKGTLEAAFIDFYGLIGELKKDEPAEINTEYFEQTLRAAVLLTSTSVSPDEDFIKAVFESEESDTSYQMFTKEDSLVVIYRVNGLNEDDTYEQVESSIRATISEDPFQTYIDAGVALLTVAVDERAKNYYGIDKVKFS